MKGRPRTRPMTRTDVARRALHARQFLETATDAAALHHGNTNVVTSNAVLAGIAAADAICGHALQECARGEAHDEAVKLLESASPHGGDYARDLRRLLAIKTSSHYSALIVSERTTADALRWAARLIDGMTAVLRGP